MSSTTVAVTGGAGFVGRSIVAQLLHEGYTVRVLARDAKEARRLLGASDKLTVITGDILDEMCLEDLLKGAQACVHLIGIIREASGGQTFEKCHVEATRAVVKACERLGVKRYLHMSALGVSELGTTAYQKSKWRAERIVADSSLKWTIFRPSLIHGKGSDFIAMITGLASGNEPPYLFIPYFVGEKADDTVPLGSVERPIPRVQPVYVGDVARSFVSALKREEAVGEIYNLAGSETLAWPSLLKTLRDATHGKESLQPVGVPAKVASIGAMVAKHVGLGALLPFDEGMPIMAAQDSLAETTKAQQHLGVRYSGFAESLATYADQL